MIGSSSLPISGIAAAAKRVDVAAANIVHARDSGPPASSKVKPVKDPNETEKQHDPLYRPRDVLQATTADGGTRAYERERTPAEVHEYAPDDPNANEDGVVARPNVDIAQELVDIIVAQRAYEAAIKASQARDETLGVTIDARS